MSTPRCQQLTIDERKAQLAALVERFAREKEFYKSKNFNEANTRLNFIDPFLELLGWDVKNEEGKTESFKNVKIETNQLQNGNVKHPDYALRLGAGQTILYVEAKQPSVNLKENPESALQVRRYGYTSKLKLSILTDFEEFCVYDTTIRPKPTDKVGVARIEYYTFDQYVENFETLYNRYSYEACNSGKMTFYAENSSNKKGTSTIDDDILQMIEEWRLLLANDIALNNSEIDEYDLTSVVQKIIDRIIFLRICEDKNVEPYGTLKELGAKNGDTEIFARFKTLFLNANAKYNAGLFAKDNFLDTISVSDKTLTKIIKQLYYPECPYEFSVLPVEILGTIYERFLGKIIQFNRKTKNGHNIVVIEKPEVQKAGGVYYTPRYIVQYIVEQTIGQKIAGKTPDHIASMRFIDPACGSGSFLVGAYDFLLRFHLDYYTQASNLKKAEKAGLVYRDAATGEYKLSVAEKKRILVNNIYGVDLDLQATEVSKVSLFLKLLEDEGRSAGEMFKQSELASEKLLPNMESNIKCGNSLVGTDFIKPELFESKMEYIKVRPFNWETEFPEVFASGGFDCVIGNPPYVAVRSGNINNKDYFKNNYRCATGQFDLYALFMEKGLKLLKNNGLLAFITESTFLNNKDFETLRKILLQETGIKKLAYLGEGVFESANVDVVISVFAKDFTENNEIEICQNSKDFTDGIYHKISQNIFNDKDSKFEIKIRGNIDDINLFEKLKNGKKTLGEITDLPRGIEIGSNSDLIHTEFNETHSKKLLVGKDIKKYTINFANRFISFENSNESIFKNENIYNQPKILIQRIRNLSLQDRIIATYDKENYLCTNTLRICILKGETKKDYNIKFILGILNSKLINHIFRTLFLNKDIYKYQLERIPIPLASPAQQEELAALVSQMLATQKQWQGALSNSDKQFLEQKAAMLEQRINAEVYSLYGLSEEEIKIIEGRMQNAE